MPKGRGVCQLARWEHVAAADRFPRFLLCVGGGDAALELFTKFESIERGLLNVLIENRPIREIAEKLRKTIDLYGRGGGAYINIFEFDPERAWDMVSEVYAYSREFYDRERG